MQVGKYRINGHAERRMAHSTAFESGRRGKLSPTPTCVRPGIVRRGLAAMLDRLVPLPFIAYLFPAWGAVVFAYQLLCDGSPSGRSVGKRVARLRVVSAASLEPCGVARSVLRRFVPALAQLAYCSWEFVWLALVYELLTLTFILLSPSGRRPEDYLAGTQVVTERAFKQARRACASCGETAPLRALYCRRCGAHNDGSEMPDGGHQNADSLAASIPDRLT